MIQCNFVGQKYDRVTNKYNDEDYYSKDEGGNKDSEEKDESQGSKSNYINDDDSIDYGNEDYGSEDYGSENYDSEDYDSGNGDSVDASDIVGNNQGAAFDNKESNSDGNDSKKASYKRYTGIDKNEDKQDKKQYIKGVNKIDGDQHLECCTSKKRKRIIKKEDKSNGTSNNLDNENCSYHSSKRRIIEQKVGKTNQNLEESMNEKIGLNLKQFSEQNGSIEFFKVFYQVCTKIIKSWTQEENLPQSTNNLH